MRYFRSKKGHSGKSLGGKGLAEGTKGSNQHCKRVQGYRNTCRFLDVVRLARSIKLVADGEASMESEAIIGLPEDLCGEIILMVVG